jgi:hypothetical protein
MNSSRETIASLSVIAEAGTRKETSTGCSSSGSWVRVSQRHQFPSSSEEVNRSSVSWKGTRDSLRDSSFAESRDRTCSDRSKQMPALKRSINSHAVTTRGTLIGGPVGPLKADLECVISTIISPLPPTSDAERPEDQSRCVARAAALSTRTLN